MVNFIKKHIVCDLKVIIMVSLLVIAMFQDGTNWRRSRSALKRVKIEKCQDDEKIPNEVEIETD